MEKDDIGTWLRATLILIVRHFENVNPKLVPQKSNRSGSYRYEGIPRAKSLTASGKVSYDLVHCERCLDDSYAIGL
jgi:hypothetical protein